MEDDEFDEEDLVPDTKSKNQENRNRSHRISHRAGYMEMHIGGLSHFSMFAAFLLDI